ncbi:MAG: hypothetical protein AAGD01_20255 [Acidobacteriota bacterium]
MVPNVSLHRRDILEIAHRHGALNVKVIHPPALIGVSEAGSLDLLIDLEPGRSLLDIVAIKQDLEDLLACKVTVSTERSLSPYLRDEVISNAKEF